jgi:F-type H+-transporting ATPase subunit epsilon
MANTIQVEIVSAEEAIFSGNATMVVVSAAAGEVGIAPGHAAFISPIKAGEVTVHSEDGEKHHIYVSGGLLEVQPYEATVLADTAIRGGDLDEAEAEEARARAQELLNEKQGTPDYAAAAAELAEASARLSVLKKIKNASK